MAQDTVTEQPRSAKAGLMRGKRGLIMGVANDHSIAWGIAKALAAEGAELAFTYQGEALGKRVKPLAQSLGAELVVPCDVEKLDTVDAAVDAVAKSFGRIDFLVHGIAYSDKNELKGRYADTTRENFVRTMIISAFSFTEIAKRVAPLMAPGGAMITLTFGGSTRVTPNYNVMGIAKAALEASVRYLAADFGAAGLRVNAISAGPVRTLAGAGHHGCALHVQFPQGPCAAPPSGDDRGCGRLGPLSPVGPVARRHGRSAFRRWRLQYRRHAASRKPEVRRKRSRGGRGRAVAGSGLLARERT